MDATGRLLALAARQHGVVTTSQAVELGMPAATFRDLRVRQGWTRHARGVWSPPSTAPSAWTDVQAALLAAGPEARATGLSALWLHGLVDRPPARHVLAVPNDVHAARHLEARVIRRTMADVEVVVVRRLPSLAVGDAMVDWCRPAAAPVPGVTEVRDLLIEAVQRRQVNLDAVSRMAQRLRSPGIRTLRAAVTELRGSGADSPLTHRVHVALRRAGLDPDRCPAEVVVPAGRTLHPDITFTARKVGIEVDGLRHHGSQRALAIDQAKDRAYRKARWDVLRIGWWDFTHRWPAFLADLRDALAGENEGRW